jgi:ribonuclease R
VKLKDLGLEGTVDLRREEEKFSFDKWEMALASKTRRYQLRQQIRVKYQPVEKPRGESASFTAI